MICLALREGSKNLFTDSVRKQGGEKVYGLGGFLEFFFKHSLKMTSLRIEKHRIVKNIALLGPLSTSEEKVLTSRCHVSQLFSQWAISTGEKGPKNFWGFFFYFHLKLWKVLTQVQLPAKNFSKTSRPKKKDLSFIESNTIAQISGWLTMA